MSLIASESGGGGDFAIAPAGTYIGRCYRILDMGTQTTTGQFGTKEQHKVMISWELLDSEVKMEDGRPFSVHQPYTVSLHEKSRLRKDLEAWRGRPFSPEELMSFDLTSVLGAYCMIQIVHDETGKYANPNAIMSYKGEKPEPVNPDLVFDIDNPDMQVFDSLSDNMKAKIMAAPEWQQSSGSQGGGQVAKPVPPATNEVRKPAPAATKQQAAVDKILPVDEVYPADEEQATDLSDIPF